VPTSLVILGDVLYSFNPTTNAIIAMGTDGSTSAVTQTTSGIGFITGGIAHVADKTIVYTTDGPGIALFDSKSNELTSQEISFSSDSPTLGDIATYGSRLYAHDRSANNIFGFSKSLRGYGSGSPWITDADFPSDSIVSFSVDGGIFTLHADGEIRRLFKGEPEDFNMEPVDPPLTGSTKIISSDEMKYLYVFDPERSRVVVYNKNGILQQQIVLDIAPDLLDVTIAADEATLYALDGTRVLAISLLDD